ncbi:MAG TPA: cytochrome c biogenesis protein CcdA [Candidatus Baltobacteraceae bacterium]
MHSHVALATALVAGLVSFVSPCVLPLVPSYLSFMTGTSIEDLKTVSSAQERVRVMGHAIAFVCGFTLIFVLFGLSSSAIGGIFADHKVIIERIGGAIVIILGLNMLGLFRIPLLAMDKRFHLGVHKQSIWLSFVVGIAFAAGWTPCIGPILSTIILIASQQKIAEATLLLLVYSLGLAIPFLIVAAAFAQSLALLNRIKGALRAIEAVSGVVLIATGIVLATDSFTRIAGIFYQYVRPPGL